MKHRLLLLLCLVPSIAFSSSSQVCLPDTVCIGDDIHSIKKKWNVAILSGPHGYWDSLVPMMSEAQLYEPRNNKTVARKDMALAFRFLPYATANIFDQKALVLLKQIKYLCDPLLLVGSYTSKMGHATRVWGMLRTSEDRSRQVFRVAVLERRFVGDADQFKNRLLQQYPSLVDIGDFRHYTHTRASELNAQAEAKHKESLNLDQPIDRKDSEQISAEIRRLKNNADTESSELREEANRVSSLTEDNISDYILQTIQAYEMLYRDPTNGVSVLLLKGKIPGLGVDQFPACAAKKAVSIE